MAFLSTTFTMPSYPNPVTSTVQDWCDLLLTNLKIAFITSNAAWEQIGTIETIGTNTDTSHGTRTIQLHSTISGKYVRIWAFAVDTIGYFTTTPTTSGGYNDIKIYLDNLFRCQSEYVCFGHNAGYSEIYFAVSDNSIGTDLGLDLGLSCPAFGLLNDSVQEGYGTVLASQYNYSAYAVGATFTVLTDGTMFSVMRKLDGQSNTIMCFYAPDMIVPANEGDTNTEGVVSNKSVTGDFYFGSNSPYDAENYISILFNDANGNHNFRRWGQGIYNSKGILCMSESSTKLLCAPLEAHLWPVNYEGSTMAGIANGVGTKGWVNMNYLRSCSVTQLVDGSVGTYYASGRWFCPAEGVLICWDNSNVDPT